MNTWEAREGSLFPLGVTYNKQDNSWNFAIYSKHATGVELLLFTEDDLRSPCYRYNLNYLFNKSARIWHCRLDGKQVGRAKYYGYRISGPYEPDHGHRFDTDKILLDPYAKVVFFPSEFSREAARFPGPNEGKAPLGVLEDFKEHDWGKLPQPEHTHDAIIYEMHVRGFTKSGNSGVDKKHRGTYTGVIQKIPYLKELGVTIIELLPVFQDDPQESNYWGYMPLNFFAPNHLYSSRTSLLAQLSEFRKMIEALHEAGFEVILDVVYNHTVEGNQNGPCYSFKGIDNTTYYLLEENRRWYRNDTGTGNVLHCANRAVRKMILDSLRYWVREMHIDGFRFDLASIFMRNTDGSLNLTDPPLISEITNDPELSNIRMIAEAWDISSYQLGRNFPGFTWLQWNGPFRDDVRAFIKGDSGKVDAMMNRLYGSEDLFPDTLEFAFHAYQSVNFVTAHDGFTLYDLVSYNRKHNEANGHNNQDGSDYNLSWNCGWEGNEKVPDEVMQLREKQVRNFGCILFLSNGIPMFRMGDEFMQTQKGNNNPYNQDNKISWLNWDLKEQHADVFRFFKHLISFRKKHPTLCRSRFWRKDVSWFGTGSQVDTSWHSHSLAFYLNGKSQQDDDLYVMINTWWKALDFRIQIGKKADWLRVIDTSLPSPEDIKLPGKEVALNSLAYKVAPRSVVVLLRRSALT